MRCIGNDWDNYLEKEFEADYYQKLRRFLDEEYAHQTIYPPAPFLYHALRKTPFQKVKVVILGQDPYHQKGQAMGLSFSVPRGIKIPPSLINIYKEIQQEYGYPIPAHGDLSSWAEQGVLLLNTTLSVRDSQPTSHQGKGWERLTDKIISLLNQREEPLVFLLWGSPARQKKKLINARKHFILESAHPSPLSAYRGFFGCRHFIQCNQFLQQHHHMEIDWRIR